MNIYDIPYYLVLGIPNAFFYVFSWLKLSKSEFRFKKLYNVLIIFVLAFILSIIHNFANSFLRIILILILLISTCLITIKSSIKDSIILSFITLASLMLGELLYCLLYVVFFNPEVLNLAATRPMAIISNIIISILGFGLCILPLTGKIYLKIQNLFSKLSKYYILIFTILILFSVNFLFVSSYYQIDTKWVIILNTIISIIYLIIVFAVFSTQNKYIKISNKYNTTLSSLKEYEEILDKYKIMNHENKNDLLMIRNMILKSEKNVDKYIDKLIDMKIKDDEKVMYETSIIPSGGLRAVIYSKILIMKDKKINSKLHVDKSVRSIDLTDYSDEFVLDLCKIINIYIDNAIEATLLTKKKEVLIQLFLDSQSRLNISITNTYIGNIELSKIDSKGYTTKGEGHGYGLNLAAQMLNKHKDMTNVRKVNKNTFNQTIILNSKK